MKASLILISPCRASRARRSSFVIGVLAIVHRLNLRPRQPLFYARLRSAERARQPAQARFGAELRRRLHRVWIIETAQRDADAVAAEAMISQRCSALPAEAALGNVRTGKGRDDSSGDG